MARAKGLSVTGRSLAHLGAIVPSRHVTLDVKWTPPPVAPRPDSPRDYDGLANLSYQ
jgi:hypothetical protein